MKQVVVLFFLSILLVSCDDILLEKPQPDWLKNEQVFPEKIRGTYVNKKDTINIATDRITLLSEFMGSKNEPLILSDSLVLRSEGNNYFLNFRSDDKWMIWLGKNEGTQIILYQLLGSDEAMRKSLGKITQMKKIKKDVLGDSTNSYIINPTDEEFKKILNKNLFKMSATYRKI